MISSNVKPKCVRLVNTPMRPRSDLAPEIGVISGIVSWGYVRSNRVSICLVKNYLSNDMLLIILLMFQKLTNNLTSRGRLENCKSIFSQTDALFDSILFNLSKFSPLKLVKGCSQSNFYSSNFFHFW